VKLYNLNDINTDKSAVESVVRKYFPIFTGRREFERGQREISLNLRGLSDGVTPGCNFRM
jgi:hypothetical protein